MSNRFFHSLPKVVPPPYHAFFSAEAARLYGYGIWETADGRLVPVTSVHDDQTEHAQKYGWEDRVDQGTVVRRLRDGRPGEWGPAVSDSFWIT